MDVLGTRDGTGAFPPAVPSGGPAIHAAPILRWAGGKTKLLPELLARMPPSFERYYEPFAGGAALFFRVASTTRPARAPGAFVLGDSNTDLIGLYSAVARDVSGVIARLERHRAAHAADARRHYYETRARWNDPGAGIDAADRAAAFIYLNKTCFNGLWRVNRAGGFNVPIGRYADPPICVPEAMRAAQAVLARAELRAGGYQETTRDAGRGDFVYFDPPYDPVATGSAGSPAPSFTAYTADEFGAEQQRELADTALRLVERGCRVMLSNSDTPYVRTLYRERGFRIDRVKCARAINSNATGRGPVDELIITSVAPRALRRAHVQLQLGGI